MSKEMWRPQVGSLVVLMGTGVTATVENVSIDPGREEFTIKVKEELYVAGSSAVAVAGDTVDIVYTPNHENPTHIALFYKSTEHRSGGDMVLSPTEHCSWKLVRHPNDGAPKTDRLKFNHWVCWDDGEHEKFTPNWRSYDYKADVPCANVKIQEPDKFLRDRAKVAEHYGRANLTDAIWAKYLKWLDDAPEAEAFGIFDHAVEDARSSIDDLFEDTGLEYEFNGRSGGWFCITNAPKKEDWELKALSQEEEDALNGYYEVERDLSEEHLEKMRELDERRDNAWSDGDKSVILAALHNMEQYADDEVAYHYVGIVVRKFEDMQEEEAQNAAAKAQREAARNTILRLTEGVRLDYELKQLYHAMSVLDTEAAADTWNWQQETGTEDEEE